MSLYVCPEVCPNDNISVASKKTLVWFVLKAGCVQDSDICIGCAFQKYLSFIRIYQTLSVFSQGVV